MTESSKQRAARLLEQEMELFNIDDAELVGFSNIEGTMTIVYDRYGHDFADVSGESKFRERRVATFRPNDSNVYGGIIETEHDRKSERGRIA